MVLAVDVGLVLVMLLSLLAGLRSGFLETLLSIGAWFGGILLALHLTSPVLRRLPAWAQEIPGSEILLGVALFLVSFLVIRIIGLAIGIGGDGKRQETATRGLGVVLGIGRGILLAGVIASFLVAFLPARGEVMRMSRVLPALAPIGRLIERVAPDWIREKMDEGWDSLLDRARFGPEEPVSTFRFEKHREGPAEAS